MARARHGAHETGAFPRSDRSGEKGGGTPSERPDRLDKPLIVLQPQRPDPGGGGRGREGKGHFLGRQDQKGINESSHEDVKKYKGLFFRPSRPGGFVVKPFPACFRRAAGL